VHPFTPGQRVRLVHRPQPQPSTWTSRYGTVHRHDPDQQQVVIDFDNGTRQTLPDGTAGLDTVTRSWTPAAGTGHTWPHALDLIRTAGQAAGRTAATVWADQELTGRDRVTAIRRARQALAAITGDDPRRSDLLPVWATLPVDQVEPPEAADLVALTTDPAPAGNAWQMITPAQHAEAVATYRDGYDTTLLEQAADHCRIVLSPTGDGRDLSHLHPDQLRIGRAGVFAGEWRWTSDGGPGRYRIAYSGTFIDRWNGWAVFSCTRQVAEAIVADNQADREQYRTELLGKGKTGADLDRALADAYTHLSFDGDIIVADQREQFEDPDAIERIGPDRDGQYVVMGWNWCWEAVDPADCEQIIGDLPALGEEQQYVLLRHTPGMRVPHDRLRAADAHRATTSTIGGPVTASLTFDGTVIAGLVNDGDGGDTRLLMPIGLNGWEGMAVYTAASRHRGEPVSEARLLDALIAEALLDQAIDRATTDGVALLRLIDDAGHTIALRLIPEAPRGWHGLRALGVSFAADSDTTAGAYWQIWTGTRWQSLPTAATTVTL
jgi:hypothetical protein